MNIIIPTIGRVVHVTLTDRNGSLQTLPAIVTHVHSDQCISVVAMSAFSDEGFHAGGTRPMQSIEYDAEGSKAGTWRWMPVQQTGGGFDARIRALEELTAQRESKALTQCIVRAKPVAKPKAKTKPRRR